MFDQNNNSQMEKIRLIIILALAMLVCSSQDYTLTLDWSLSSQSSNSQVGYVTWNEQTVITLTAFPGKPKSNHESVGVTFQQGPNQLGIYFIGLSGSLNIDDVSLTKDGSVINYILNGDFEMCQLASNEQNRTFNNKIPGWNAPQILISKSSNKGVHLVLNTQLRSITQTITFGMVSKYQFIDQMNIAIQNQAKNIINSNIQSLNTTIQGNIWNNANVPTSRTYTSTAPPSQINPPPLPTTNITNPIPAILQSQQGQALTNQVSQILQMMSNVTGLLH